jgi:hypothetical protein
MDHWWNCSSYRKIIINHEDRCSTDPSRTSITQRIKEKTAPKNARDAKKISTGINDPPSTLMPAVITGNIVKAVFKADVDIPKAVPTSFGEAFPDILPITSS